MRYYKETKLSRAEGRSGICPPPPPPTLTQRVTFTVQVIPQRGARDKRLATVINFGKLIVNTLVNNPFPASLFTEIPVLTGSSSRGKVTVRHESPSTRFSDHQISTADDDG